MDITHTTDLELLRKVRRHVHRWPELGHEEQRTSALVADVLSSFGLEVLRPASTAVATVVGRPGLPEVALRAELDGIACHEATKLPYASERRGHMHACGHDGHLATLTLVARRLSRDPPKRPALFVFQHAEETHPSGAEELLDGLGPDLWPAQEAYAIHLWPELPEGTVGLRTGPIMPGVAGVEITFHASQGRTHGTRVDEGAGDAVRSVFRLYSSLESLNMGRRVADTHPVALHIGVAAAGEAPNRPAQSGVLRGTMRWLTEAARDEQLDALRTIAATVARETNVDVQVTVNGEIRPALVNDARGAKRAVQACRDAGLEVVEYPAAPLGVSEDFGHYLKQASGALMLVGCGSAVDAADLHSATFNFREECLLAAADALENLVRRSSPSQE